MKMKKIPLIIFLTLTVLLQAAGIVPASAAGADSALAPDNVPVSVIGTAPAPASDDSPTLRIYSGYEGQDNSVFQLLAEYTVEDLEQMELTEEDYTLLDQEAGVIVCHALGVPLQEILEHAGIDPEEIESLEFRTDDGRRVELDIGMLLEDQRYCFYDLPEWYDPETGKIKKEKSGLRQRVPSMVAWLELWLRASEYSLDELNEIWEQAEELNGGQAFHLLFGQCEIDEALADRALAEVTEIIALQEGNPPVTETPEIGVSETQDDGGGTAPAGESETEESVGIADSENQDDKDGTTPAGEPEKETIRAAYNIENNRKSGTLLPDHESYQETEKQADTGTGSGLSAGLRTSSEPSPLQISRTEASEQQPAVNNPEPVSLSERQTSNVEQQIPSPETSGAEEPIPSEAAGTPRRDIEELSETIPRSEASPSEQEPDAPPAPAATAAPKAVGGTTMSRSSTWSQPTEPVLREIEFGPSGTSELFPMEINPQISPSRSRQSAGETDTATLQEEEREDSRQDREPASPAEISEVPEPEEQKDTWTGGRIYEMAISEGENGTMRRGYAPASPATISRKTLAFLFGVPFFTGAFIELLYIWWNHDGPERLKRRR